MKTLDVPLSALNPKLKEWLETLAEQETRLVEEAGESYEIVDIYWFEHHIKLWLELTASPVSA